jgi:hypothetical protein
MASPPSKIGEELGDTLRAVKSLKRVQGACEKQIVGPSTSHCIYHLAGVLLAQSTAREAFQSDSHNTQATKLYTAGVLEAETKITDAIEKLLKLKREEIKKSTKETNDGIVRNGDDEGCKVKKERDGLKSNGGTSEDEGMRKDQEYDLVDE